MGRRTAVSLIAGSALLVLFALVAAFVVAPTDDLPQAPDAVVVLGGGSSARAELGIALADRHDADLVLSSTAAVFGERLGRRCGSDALCFEPEPSNTGGEAASVARLATEQGWQEITVATSWFHTSRTRLLFQQCLGPQAVTVVGTERTGSLPWQAYVLLRESLAIIVDQTVRRPC